jgi:hypothetical protein
MVGHRTEAIYRRYAIVEAGALRDAAAKIDRAAGGLVVGQFGNVQREIRRVYLYRYIKTALQRLH